MNKLKVICAAILILTVASSVLLTSCGKDESFVPVTVITTQPQTTEPETFVYSEFEMFGTKMGMSIEEAQKALDVPIEVYTSDKGLLYFIVQKKDLLFVNKDIDTTVFFIFNEKGRLCEIQYASTEENGFVLKDAIANYDSQYGKHIEDNSDETKKNYVWYKDGVYIVITTVIDGQNAMSFFDKEYFEKNYPEDAQAYNAR